MWRKEDRDRRGVKVKRCRGRNGRGRAGRKWRKCSKKSRRADGTELMHGRGRAALMSGWERDPERQRERDEYL